MPMPWRRWLRRNFPFLAPGRRCRAPGPVRSERVRLELLEDRTAPAVYKVTTNADVVDPTDGVLSLREAVLAANASLGVADVIDLPAGTYTLRRAGADEDMADAGDLDLW